MTDRERRTAETETRTDRGQDIHAEACGRCSMSTVVGAVSEDRSPAERAERDPFGGERIEIEASSIRRVSPGGFLSDLKARLDALGRRLAYGK